MSDDDSERPYSVGYRRPPKQHEFQRGRSGNPAGRPKKGASLKDHIKRNLKKKQRVVVGGKSVLMTSEEIVAARVVMKALEGRVDMIKLAFLLADYGKIDENTIRQDERGKINRENEDARDYVYNKLEEMAKRLEQRNSTRKP